MKLPMSKVGDGVCDCCDGADETGITSCPDNCAAIFAEERRRRQALQYAYTKGSLQRQSDLQEYAALVQTSTATLVTKQAELESLQASLVENDDALKTAKQNWIQKRWETYATRVKQVLGGVQTTSSSSSSPTPDLRDLVYPLTTTELQALIVHACQMAGEMPEASRYPKKNTCVPLRLAGLAASMGWEPTTYELIHATSSSYELDAWANVVHANLQASSSSSLKWHPSQVASSTSSKNRRRLDDYIDPHYEEEDELYDDYRRYEEDMDDDEEEVQYDRRHRNSRRNNNNSNNADEKEGDSNLRETQTTWVKEQVFSVPRVRFLTQTDTLLKMLDELTKDNDDDDDNGTAQGDGEEQQGKEEAETVPQPPAGFDPMAVPLLRTQIQKRRDAIEQGFTYAVSARVLLQNVQDRDILQSLLFGVWYYGKLSAWHMWQIYQGVVPELGGTMEDDAESCRAVWACPPAAATRRVGKEDIMLPPAFFVEVADVHCRSSAMKDMDASTVCAVADDGSIPSEVADGLYGYFQVDPRSADDAANVLFDGLNLEEDNSDEYRKVQDLLETKDKLESEISDVEREISRVKDVLGQNDDGTNKYGPDGELYSLRDKCLEITAGKYVYELCLFKSSKQKEGQSKGGTDLGRWSGSSLTEDGQRVWSWENGANCWNGPKRSAWAYLKCGATTKIISADEPETCKYVFEVESHIACDEDYRIKNNLS